MKDSSVDNVLVDVAFRTELKRDLRHQAAKQWPGIVCVIGGTVLTVIRPDALASILLGTFAGVLWGYNVFVSACYDGAMRGWRATLDAWKRADR